MIRGLYTAAAGMLTQQKRQDILTNNLANINTPGYKQDQAMMRSFPEVFLQAIQEPFAANKQIGSIHQGVFIEESVPIFTQGDLIETNDPYHLAIIDQDLPIDPTTGLKPSLFFTAVDGKGNRFYTRSGVFTEDAAGQLVTPEGYLILDDLGFPIQVNGRTFKVDEKGLMTFSDGEQIRIGLSVINDPKQLLKQGNNMYRLNDNNNPPMVDPNGNYQIQQGKIERANVDPSQTMVDMLTALRLYEANQKVIQSLDRTLEKAANEIGRV